MDIFSWERVEDQLTSTDNSITTMFRSIKNIATEIRSEITPSTPSDHTDNGSRARRFLSSNGQSSSNSNSYRNSSEGYDTESSEGRRHHFRRSKNKAIGEVDGRTEDDTVVHRALMKYYREQGLPIPDFLGGRQLAVNGAPLGASSSATVPTAEIPRSAPAPAPAPVTTQPRSTSVPPRAGGSRFAQSSRSPQPRQAPTMPQEQRDTSQFQIPARSRASLDMRHSGSGSGRIGGESEGRPQVRRAATEEPSHGQQQHHGSRFQSRFGGGASAGGSISGGSRFGRRV